MRISIAGKPAALSPRGVNWEEPPIVAHTANGAPIFGQYWRATLSIDIPVDPAVASFQEWCGLRDGNRYIFTLPHPATGELADFEAYLESAIGRFDTRGDCAIAVGFDITLSWIRVS